MAEQDTLKRLKLKAGFGTSDSTRMPSLKAIAELLDKEGIKYQLTDSQNVVEFRSKGNTYVNSRHMGKKGGLLKINLTDAEKEFVNCNWIELDTSDSYYSYNTNSHARQIVALINYRQKRRKVVGQAFDFLCDRNVLKIDQVIYVGMLMEFQEIHGDEAIIALAGFYTWCISHNQEDNIQPTFAHDLHGRNEEFMSPRSSSYAEFFIPNDRPKKSAQKSHAI